MGYADRTRLAYGVLHGTSHCIGILKTALKCVLRSTEA